MSRTSMSTGGIVFNQGKAAKPQEKTEGYQASGSEPMRIVILSDFSGRASQNIIEPETLSSRRFTTIDRDNFEEVFSNFKVNLGLSICDKPIAFQEFDDLHPDYIYERVPLFDELRRLERKLKKKDKFAEAANEIRQWAQFRIDEDPQPASVSQQPLEAIDTDNLLDSILGGASTSSAPTPEGQLDDMIKDIVAPFIEPKADPELKPMLAAVTEATSDLMRKLMHSSQFQELEASWRSLYLLVRRLETSNKLKISIVDVNKAELLADLSSGDDLSQTQSYKLLTQDTNIAGGKPISLILGDFTLSDTKADCALASALATIAAVNGGSAVCGGSEKIAGCDNLTESQGTEDWSYTPTSDFSESWAALRESPDAQHLAVCAPRFLLRLPYGKRTSVTENFAYEELPEEAKHNYYLWGNSAYLVALLIGQSYTQHGWLASPSKINTLEGLPVHAYSDDFEDYVKPCAEILLTDKMVEEFSSSGLMSVRSVKERDAVIIPNFRAVSSHEAWLGFWRA